MYSSGKVSVDEDYVLFETHFYMRARRCGGAALLYENNTCSSNSIDSQPLRYHHKAHATSDITSIAKGFLKNSFDFL